MYRVQGEETIGLIQENDCSFSGLGAMRVKHFGAYRDPIGATSVYPRMNLESVSFLACAMKVWVLRRVWDCILTPGKPFELSEVLHVKTLALNA